MFLGRDLAVGDRSGALQGTDRARGDANALAIDTDGLQIHVLLAAGRDVGVAARVHDACALAGKLVDAGHRNGRKISGVPGFCKEGRSMP